MKGAVNRRKIVVPSQGPQFAPPILLPESGNSAEIEPKTAENSANQPRNENDNELSSQRADNSKTINDRPLRRSMRERQLPDRFGEAYCHFLEGEDCRKNKRKIEKNMENILGYFSDQENSDEEILLSEKIRIAENSGNKFVDASQGNKVRSFSYDSAKTKVAKLCQLRLNYWKGVLQIISAMEDQQQGKEDNFLEELMQFLNDEEGELKENEEIKNNCEQVDSPTHHIGPNRAEPNTDMTDVGPNSGPGLMADLPNAVGANEGAQPQTRTSTAEENKINIEPTACNDMDTGLTRVSESQLSPGLTGTAQNPGQSTKDDDMKEMLGQCNDNNFAATNDLPHDVCQSTTSSESVKAVTPSQTAQTTDVVHSPSKHTGTQVSGRIAYKGQPPQRAPPPGGPSQAMHQHHTEPTAVVVGPRETDDAVLELEDGEQLSDTESTSSTSSSSTSSASSSSEEEPEPAAAEPLANPAPALQFPPEQTDWILESTTASIRASIEKTDRPKEGRCRVCGFRAALRRVRVHVKQHKCRYFCPCMLNSVSRDSVYEHQKRHRGRPGTHHPLYTVDEHNYQDFCRAMGWSEPPAFQPCVPTRGGSTAREGSPRPRREPQPSALNPARPRAPVRQQRAQSPARQRPRSPPRRPRSPPRPRVSPHRETTRPRPCQPSPRHDTPDRLPVRERLGRREATPTRHRRQSADRPRAREVPAAVFNCRDYRLEEPDFDEQRRIVVRRLGFTPRSHRIEYEFNWRGIEDRADDMEREIRILRREPIRAPISPRTRRALELQIDHLEGQVRRHRAASRTLQGLAPPPSKRQKK